MLPHQWLTCETFCLSRKSHESRARDRERESKKVKERARKERERERLYFYYIYVFILLCFYLLISPFYYSSTFNMQRCICIEYIELNTFYCK